MRKPLLTALFLAAALATESSASAQVQIATSSPDAVMASLAELHESWTHDQFLDFMRAAIMARLPDEVEDPASWQESRYRWEFLPDTLAIFAGISITVPLVLEGEPLFDFPDPEKFEPWLQKILRHGLEDTTIEALVRFGRSRESAVLVRFRERAAVELRELEEQVESAQAGASRPGASIQDKRVFERLQRRLADLPTHIERLDRRLDDLEAVAEFAPGAVGCSLVGRIDLSTEEAMLADLEALAETCPQQLLIRFLRAAVFISEVPAGLAEPGARMEAAALLRTKDRLSSAVQAIVGLAAFLQKDPLIRGTDSVPARLKTLLDRALDERTAPEVLRDGEKLERAFLTALREDASRQLRSETERRRGETSEQESTAPQRPSRETRRLRADIERIDRRLAMLGAETPAPRPPSAH